MGMVSFPYVYLRGTVTSEAAERLLESSVFEHLRNTSSFGTNPFGVTLYASTAGMQTNLHVDEHSGFLVQVIGRKRVVLFDKSSRALRCATWGAVDAPINRRSWYDAGVPDVPGW